MRQNANSKTIDLNLIINNHIKYKQFKHAYQKIQIFRFTFKKARPNYMLLIRKHTLSRGHKQAQCEKKKMNQANTNLKEAGVATLSENQISPHREYYQVQKLFNNFKEAKSSQGYNFNSLP